MNKDEAEALARKAEDRAYDRAKQLGIVPGARVRIVGCDCWGDPDGIGSTGHILYDRGPWEYWTYVDRWNGLGSTFPIDSLEAI